MRRKPTESVWFHLFDDRREAAELELRSLLLMRLQEIVASESSAREAIEAKQLESIETGRVNELSTEDLALIAHDLGCQIDVTLSRED